MQQVEQLAQQQPQQVAEQLLQEQEQEVLLVLLLLQPRHRPMHSIWPSIRLC